MSDSIDYNRIDPDSDKEPEEYHYTERRAELLTMIERSGSPKRLDTARLAERYGCTRKTIYNDFDALAEHIASTLGTRAELRTQALFERVIDKLLDEGEEREAWRTVMEWNEWLVDRGAIDKVPQKTELDARVAHTDGDESDSYRVVSEKDETVEMQEVATGAEED